MMGSIPEIIILLLDVEPFGRNIYLAADNRFQTILFCACIKVNRTNLITVVGHGYGGHFIFLGSLEKSVMPDGGI
jgi:hypothetical protein